MPPVPVCSPSSYCRIAWSLRTTLDLRLNGRQFCLNPSAPTATADEKDLVDAARLLRYSRLPMKANKESEITEAFETAGR